ncbi:hypothetical protein ILP92_12925 [Maribius pontilimi]|uniref:Response regulatory domain-containing protein n=1 Tax=Palleronia pontilimi TaxID=1964209 RepID=A0A934MD95_9RHOB|nr:hypothetical protein [Palleronia pontilimi]MBJ3763653.1 hypothetical protein [Palleronia pontilimi]
MKIQNEQALGMTPNPMSRILLVSGNDATNEEIEALVEASPRIMVFPIEVSALKTNLTPEAGDLVIVNVSALTEAEIELLSDVRAAVPHMPLIVSSPALTADETRRLFKFNVHDWMPKPVDGKDLIESIFKGVRFRKTYNNRVHAVVSSVGGVGATTLAVSMADIAAQRMFKKRSVALFDLDFSLGDCSYAINMINGYNLASVAAAPHRVDAEFIRVIQKQHENGFAVYSFKRPELNSEINGYELVLRLLDAVTIEHDQTFVDIPYYETEWKDDVLSAVNTCTLVTELNMSALKHTVDLIDRIRELRGKDFALQVVVNKYESRLFGQRIGKSRLKELFGDVPFTYLPLASAQIGEAVDRGVPPSEVAHRSRFLNALQKYMKSMELTEVSA